MRKIDKEVSRCFWGRKSLSKGNTQVILRQNSVELHLFGNKIAELYENKLLAISAVGWLTQTTRNRLNAILSPLDGSISGSTRTGRNNWYLHYRGENHRVPKHAVLQINTATDRVGYKDSWETQGYQREAA